MAGKIWQKPLFLVLVCVCVWGGVQVLVGSWPSHNPKCFQAYLRSSQTLNSQHHSNVQSALRSKGELSVLSPYKTIITAYKQAKENPHSKKEVLDNSKKRLVQCKSKSTQGQQRLHLSVQYLEYTQWHYLSFTGLAPISDHSFSRHSTFLSSPTSQGLS